MSTIIIVYVIILHIAIMLTRCPHFLTFLFPVCIEFFQSADMENGSLQIPKRGISIEGIQVRSVLDKESVFIKELIRENCMKHEGQNGPSCFFSQLSHASLI